MGVYGSLLAFFLLISLIGILGYQLMCLTDLEFDYINPYDLASRINKIVVPEFVTQGVLCLVYLLTGNWFMCLLSLPYLYHNVTLYMRRRHLIDVTEIYNQLSWEKKQRLIKLGHLLMLFVISIAWLIWSVLEDTD